MTPEREAEIREHIENGDSWPSICGRQMLRDCLAQIAALRAELAQVREACVKLVAAVELARTTRSDYRTYPSHGNAFACIEARKQLDVALSEARS